LPPDWTNCRTALTCGSAAVPVAPKCGSVPMVKQAEALTVTSVAAGMMS
jgi:hypothetical protein